MDSRTSRIIKRTRYPQQAKAEAITLIRRGESIASAARTLGIPRKTLSDWVKAEIHGNMTNKPSNSAQAATIAQLQQELAQRTLERDMLVKVIVRLARMTE